MRFGETKRAKEKFYAAKKTINIWDVNADNIVVSKLIETKYNSKYLNGCLDKAIKPLVLIMPKMSMLTYLKLKMEVKIKAINDEKLLEKYKAIWTKIEDLNIELNVLSFYDDRYIKTKIRIYGDKVYTNFRSLNWPQDYSECQSVTRKQIL